MVMFAAIFVSTVSESSAVNLAESETEVSPGVSNIFSGGTVTYPIVLIPAAYFHFQPFVRVAFAVPLVKERVICDTPVVGGEGVIPVPTDTRSTVPFAPKVGGAMSGVIVNVTS